MIILLSVVNASRSSAVNEDKHKWIYQLSECLNESLNTELEAKSKRLSRRQSGIFRRD